MAKKLAKKSGDKPSKKPISVHVSDEERSLFHRAMLKDHMVDLGPWIAKVVREYISDDAESPSLETLEQQIAYAEELLVKVKQKFEDTKKSQRK